MPILVNISLPLPEDKLFTYIVPDELFPKDSINNNILGRRALVPFGKRTLTGVIVEISKDIDKKGLKSIFELLDEKPVFSEKMLNFTKWIAEYYLCSWGETLKAALPQGMSPKSIMQVKIVNRPAKEDIDFIKRIAPKRAALLNVLLEHNKYISVNYLEEQLKSSSVSLQLEALEQSGIIKCERLVEKDKTPRFQKALIINPELLSNNEKLKNVLDTLDKKAPKQALLLSHIYMNDIQNTKPVLIADALKELNISSSTVKSLIENELIEVVDIEINRSIIDKNNNNLSRRNEFELPLTNEQQFALNKIIESLAQKKFSPFLLHGVTGSGKTLVYIHAIKHALSEGKSSLLLVPEISLTPQLIDRFQTVFPDKIAVLHSRMSQGERYDAWRTIQRGESQIVIGARSAIFAPLENLGLIIVDEEHEPTYKQDSPAPRYNARDAAIYRARLEDAAIVLGSATPSLESMYNSRNGKYSLLEIKNRADGALLPEIRIIDTLQARKTGQMHGSLSSELISAIKSRLLKKEGIIIFQNRRGFSPLLECKDCGHIPMCKYCSVTMTFHKAKNQLRCHYCGYTIQSYKSCPVCGHPELNEIGFGTQRIEDELNECLKDIEPKPIIARMDLDTTSRKGSHRKILQRFYDGEIDILLGTQMVAKGLDFERVTLVGVINADLQLFLPDFRASERTFQLLTQVAGRAGRTSQHPGQVLIQSAHSDNFSIVNVIRGSFDDFYNEEIQHRGEALYPPFSRFVLIEFYGKDEKIVDKHSKLFTNLIPRKEKSIFILGPSRPTIVLVRSNFRRIIIIKNNKLSDPNGTNLRQALKIANEAYKKNYASSSVKVSIDIDSFSSL